MSERRYNEEEVAAIFAKAAESQEGIVRRPASSGTGMTLPELQEIGREVGISPDAIARAAGMIHHVQHPVSRRFLGLPLGVGNSIELNRRLTDEEWEQLVVDLRETFDARGHVSTHGSLRQWTNGNLQALLEPTPNGHRLRLQTVKGSSRAYMMAGLGTLGVGVVTTIGAAIGGVLSPNALGSLAPMIAIGTGLFGLGAVTLPSWAKKRKSQMEGIIARLAARQATPPPEEDS